MTPKSAIAAINKLVAIGLRMKVSEKAMPTSSPREQAARSDRAHAADRSGDVLIR
jgi:hypothetical protein